MAPTPAAQNRTDGKQAAAAAGKTTKPELETAPEPMDDGQEVDGQEEGAGVERERLANDEQQQSKSVRPELWKDDARERIAKLYREQRNREMAAESGEAGEQQGEGEEGAEPAGDAPEAVAQDRAAAAEPAPRADGQQKVKIVVDGKEEFLPLDEVVRRAQINSAVDNRLEEAKRLLREAKEVRAQPANQPAASAPPQQGAQAPISQPDQPDQGAQNQRATAKALDPAMLKSIIERIQVGDTDDGAAALAEFANAVRPSESAKQGVDVAEVGRVVAQQLVLSQTEASMNAALERFKEKYPQIAEDNDLGVTGLGILARTLVDELKAHAGLTDEQLAPFRTNVRQLAHATAELKRRGKNVRSFDELLDATGDVMAQKYGLKPRSDASQDPPPASRQPNPPAGNVRIASEAEIRQRQDRKRAMPSQPRPAGVRTAPPPAPRPRTAAEIVADTRRARGFN